MVAIADLEEALAATKERIESYGKKQAAFSKLRGELEAARDQQDKDVAKAKALRLAIDAMEEVA